MKPTKVQIIKETFRFYNKDISRRSISPTDHQCYYFRFNKKCAVGRLLDYRKVRNPDSLGIGLYKILSFLKEKYKGHEHSFWMKLQRLHDDSDNWTDKGISSEGMARYKYLLEEYKCE